MDKEKALENQGSKFREDIIEQGGITICSVSRYAT